MTLLRQQAPVAGPTAPAAPAAAAEVLEYRPRKRRYRSLESASRTEKILAYTLLLVGSAIFLVPFYFVINASLKSEAEVNAGHFVSPPRSLAEVQFRNYPRSLA